MGAQERQAFNDLLDHNRILELEMREVQARTKLHSDMQQTHVVHPAAALSEQREKHAALRETVERVTTQYSESPASSARSSTVAPPMAADLTDSLDPIPVHRPRRLSHQIEVDLTME